VIVSHESIRAWSQKFGQAYANGLRRRRQRPGDKWHLDEVFIKVNGQRHYLWRAVDQHGNVVDILVTSQRNAKAATRFFRKLFNHGDRHRTRRAALERGPDLPGGTRSRSAEEVAGRTTAHGRRCVPSAGGCHRRRAWSPVAGRG
jgi:transposase-like protein